MRVKMLNLIGCASLRHAVIRSKSRRIRQFPGLEKPRCKEVSGDRVFLNTEKNILYFVDWTGLDWTGLVRRGLVKRRLVKRGLVKRGLVKRGLVKHGLVKRGLVKRGLVKMK